MAGYQPTGAREGTSSDFWGAVGRGLMASRSPEQEAAYWRSRGANIGPGAQPLGGVQPSAASPTPAGVEALRARQSSGAGAYGPGYSGGADLTSPFDQASRVTNAPLGSPSGGGASPAPQMSLLRDTVAADMAPGQGYRANQYGIPGVYQGSQRFGQTEVPLFYNQGARPLGGVDATQRVKDEAQAITDRSMAQSPYAMALQRGPQQPERVVGPFSMARGPGGPDYSFADQMQSMALDRLGKAQYAQQRDAALGMLKDVPQMRREADLSYYQPRQFEQTQAMEREKMASEMARQKMILGGQMDQTRYQYDALGGMKLEEQKRDQAFQQGLYDRALKGNRPAPALGGEAQKAVTDMMLSAQSAGAKAENPALQQFLRQPQEYLAGLPEGALQTAFADMMRQYRSTLGIPEMQSRYSYQPEYKKPGLIAGMTGYGY